VSAVVEPPAAPAASASPAAAAPASASEEARLLDNWLAIQAENLTRHAASLRAFRLGEFGTGPAAPSEAHVEAVNRFIAPFRDEVVDRARWLDAAVQIARREPTPARLNTVLDRKHAVAARVTYVEGIWDFYFDLFVQRLSGFGERLRAIDRVGANSYEDVYLAMGTARPTPRLLPFSYAQSGFSPATYRRGVPMSKLRHNANPFPLVMIPQHRLENVWALSSVLHEISHNLQADIGLWEEMPVRILERLRDREHIPEPVAHTWARWHKEMVADMFALVLGGPAAIESLMDVVGRQRDATVTFDPNGVHPTPVLRVPINLAALRRLGFPRRANDLARVWRRLYPAVGEHDIPRAMLSTFERACEAAVDTMVFTPYKQFGGKSLAALVEFGEPQMRMIEEAGRRLAAGQDPGSVPPRYLIGAARHALDRRLAPASQITDAFYRVLGRR
jgi:hypothetical protein